jgi:hypothetical protein
LQSPKPNKMKHEDSPNRMFYATSASKVFSPTATDAKKRSMGKASRKYLPPKLVKLNISSEDVNDDK